MGQFDVFSLGLIGLFLLAIPAVMAGFFPFVEKSVSLIVITLGLNSIKGILFWVLVVGAFIYLTGLPALSALLRNLSTGSF